MTLLVANGTARSANAGAIPELLANPSFEENGGLGTDFFGGWTTSVVPGSSGSWYVQAGSVNPLFPEGTAATDLPPPPDGLFAAMTDQIGPGSRILFQDIQLPFAAIALRCAIFLASGTNDFIISNSLAFGGPANQHFRIDVVDPAAPLFSVLPGDVLQNVYISSPGSPGTLSHPMAGYAVISASLNALAGQNVRLRVAQVDNQYFFTAGVDQCVIEEAGCLDCTELEVRCDDCIDDDRDGLVDRDDPDCPARADGAGLGLMDLAAGRAVADCQRAIEQAALTFVKRKTKRLHRCMDAVFACLQQKPDDVSCLEKARAACAGEMVKGNDAALGDAAQLGQGIVKACGATVTVADLLDVRGLGYEAEVEACAGVGVPSLASVSDVAECVVRQHECGVEELLAAEVPRAAELLALAGVARADVACVSDGADGDGNGVGEARVRGKAAVKCQRAIMRAGAAYVQAAHNRRRKCADQVLGCVQQAPGDGGCLAAARTICSRERAKLGSGPKSDEARLGNAIRKACGAKRDGTPPQVQLDDLLEANGLGFARGSQCQALGISALDTLDEVTECVLREHSCRVERFLESTTPRFEETETLGQSL